MLDLNDILHTVGRPLNACARSRQLSQGDPIYFVAHLPYQQTYPLIAEYATNENAFAAVWSEACGAVESFYAEAPELQDKPIWAIDELALNQFRDKALDAYKTSHPEVIPCFLDRALTRTDELRLHINRSLLSENGLVARTGSPSILAGRPGTPSIPEQIQSIAGFCARKGSRDIVLVDSGFASGNSMLQLCTWFEDAGLQVDKVMGGIGSTQSYELLKDYEPECIVQFDLQNSGWVESRDFFMFFNSGTPIVTKTDIPEVYAIATKPLPSGAEIGFAVPYAAYGGRWFRLGNEAQIKQLTSRCFMYTQHLYDSLARDISIAELAAWYAKTGRTFLLPVDFGDLDARYRDIDEKMPITTYLERFRQL